MELKVEDRTEKTTKEKFSALKLGDVFSGEMNVCLPGGNDPKYRYRGKMMKTNEDRVLTLSGFWVHLDDELRGRYVIAYTVLPGAVVTNYVSRKATLIIE